MADQVRKDFLENVIFSSEASAWILQAHGFFYSADATMKGNHVENGKRFISANEGHSWRFCYKVSCYLLAHSIEVGLKAIYCINNGEKVEKFSHNIIELVNDLSEKKIIRKDEFNEGTIELAYILLDWYGRYHKPIDRKMQEKITQLYIQSKNNPDMLEKKYKIERDTYEKLRDISHRILKKLPSPNSVACLIFDPF